MFTFKIDLRHPVVLCGLKHLNLTLSASIVLRLEINSRYFCSRSRNFISTRLSGFSKWFFNSSNAEKREKGQFITWNRKRTIIIIKKEQIQQLLLIRKEYLRPKFLFITFHRRRPIPYFGIHFVLIPLQCYVQSIC